MLKHKTLALCLFGLLWGPSVLLASEPKESPTPLSAEPAPKKFENVKKESKDRAPIELTKGDYEAKAIPKGTSQQREQARPIIEHNRVNGKVQNQFNNMITAITDDITPLCTTLDINTIYTLEDPTTGGSYCYHFEVTQRAKTQAFLVGQNENTDFALTLVRHEPDDTLTSLGTSDSAGNIDESVLALTNGGRGLLLADGCQCLRRIAHPVWCDCRDRYRCTGA